MNVTNQKSALFDLYRELIYGIEKLGNSIVLMIY